MMTCMLLKDINCVPKNCLYFGFNQKGPNALTVYRGNREGKKTISLAGKTLRTLNFAKIRECVLIPKL